MEYFNDTLLNLYANQQCVVKATKKHITRFMEKNTSVVVAFNGLSCEAIQIYREDICDVVYNIDSGGESTTITTDDSEGNDLNHRIHQQWLHQYIKQVCLYVKIPY